ncbi:MATE family efflux transporter [Rhodopirellula sallentina]|uniref:MATE efflux family protein n=1 Tax=Rhodopirellula sallentina SM41 TaxID=1263870 RepID=M5U621_9BACT|nr:MATE family efflux transporter [Rhodopirellula sallentina]EMI53301.1 MATE efflux family protein [Rhodopirellula sallentina SM41]
MSSENHSRKDSHSFGYRAILAVAIPLAATVGCFSITLFTDRTLLMWYGPTSSAASVSAGNLYWAVACVPVSMMGFITPLVAITLGRRRDRGAVNRRTWALVWQCIWMTLACIPILVFVGWLSPRVFEAFGHEADLALQEARYFRTLLFVAPASMLEAGLTAFFVGRRITKPILRTNVASSALNVVLDFWLIFGGLGIPALGVWGAASATVIAMWFKVFVFAVLLSRVRSFGRHFAESWKPDAALIHEIAVPGSALGIQQLVRSALFSLLMLLIGAASVTGLAATSAALSLYQLLSIPAIGLATAVTVVTGQAFASGGIALAGQVMRRSLVIGGAGVVILAVLLLGFPYFLLQVSLGGLTASERGEIEPVAVLLLRYAAVYGIFDVASMLLGASAKGIGKTFVILVATAVPGMIAMLGGFALSPEGASAVEHWWGVLIVWSLAQAGIIAIGMRRMLLAGAGPQTAGCANEAPGSTMVTGR